MTGTALPPAPTKTAPNASDLCTQCGLCCDGTLFARARAFPDDLPGLAEHGLTVLDQGEGEKPGFAQPCPRLEGTCCTIYTERPTVCRRFRCALLMRLDSGKIDVTAALTTVAKARALVAAVEPEARPMAGRFEQRRSTSGWRDIADPELRGVTARRHLLIIALEHHLNTYFRRPRTDPPKE